ncbi:MAG: DUF6114 domain-containing protein [Thermoplasmata archaeon]
MAPPPTAIPTFPAERPSAPFFLSILGGVFITLAATAEVYFGLVSTFPPFGGTNDTYLAFGAFGTGLGVLIIVLGSLLLTWPERHVELGIAITVLAVVSIVSFYGGFLIGIALAAAGGVGAIGWQPRPTMGGWAIPPWQVPAQRACLHCGRFLTFEMRVCPYCGTPVG